MALQGKLQMTYVEHHYVKKQGLNQQFDIKAAYSVTMNIFTKNIFSF